MMPEPEELSTVGDDVDEDEAPTAYDIATYPSDFTLEGIYQMWKGGDITIPEFQREFVWTIKQSSLLIESFLSGLPVPPVFFYIDDENKNLVIDGQQRLLSVIFFLEGYFGFENLQGRRQIFRLMGLDPKSPYHKKKFVDLPQNVQRKLKTAVLRAINIRQLQPSNENTSIYHIFERLNTGGTPLKPQEIRNCVFRGGMVKVLRELNEDKNWRQLLGRQKLDKHQKDVELVLRVLSLSGTSASYEKPMKEYLNKFMKKSRRGDTLAVKRAAALFPKAAKLIVTKLGPKPFSARGPLNTSILDSVFCTVMDNIEKLPENLPRRFTILMKDKHFETLTTTGTTDTNSVRERFRLVRKALVGR
jgi:hypothetical protein